MTRTIHIGTRGSQLALWQANWVKHQLEGLHRNLSVELQIIKTTGDKILDTPLAKVGGKGLFVKEIEDALLDHRVDLAVHSMKDMPVQVPQGLFIGAVPQREDPRDVYISKGGKTLSGLPIGARIGTSSLRRAAQIRSIRDDLVVVPLRGNVQTRLRKLDEGEVDATILAAAGIKRMALWDRVTEVFDPEKMLPAVGQGALCVEIRAGDPAILDLIAPLDHPETRTVVTAERAFLRRLEGGCQVPIAAHGSLLNGTIRLSGLVASLDGKKCHREMDSAPVTEAEHLGDRLAQTLLSHGAGHILEELKANAQDNL